MAPTFEQAQAGYRNLWNKAKVLPSKRAALESIAKKIIANKPKYVAVEKRCGVPWFMTGAIHNRESSLNFAGVLHNGEHIIGTGRKTKLVPAGRGPFDSWEEAAVDALASPPHSLGKVKDWSIERILYEIERFNGWGYLGKTNSPYVWSFTDQYSGGKYIADHVFSHTAVDQQAGCAAVLKVLAELDTTIASRLAGKAPPPPDIEPTKPKTGWLETLLKLFGRK